MPPTWLPAQSTKPPSSPGCRARDRAGRVPAKHRLSFVDFNFFPDFTSNGEAGEDFAQPPLGTPIDAVISMDYYTAAKMLELTGPLSVPGYEITVDANNFISEV